jgi:single-stranded DNA-binding protein
VDVVAVDTTVDETLEPGRRVLITGRLAERRWEERSGVRHRRLEVLAASVRLL